jgi:uncharacterized protein YndB with AHSA1/START domain
VSGTNLTFIRDYDLPRQIVWDALIDPDLVSGWLAEADIDPRPGGKFNLAWRGSANLSATAGTIAFLDEPSLLVVTTSNLGTLQFRLDERDGGTRGTSSRLTVTVTAETEERLAASTGAHWMTNLEQLESLVRGRPVDWANWDRDWHPVWQDYLSNKKVTKPL